MDIVRFAIRDAFVGSFVFFVISNAFVFFCCDMYSKDVYGLVECYIMAIPFFINRLTLNIFFISLLSRIAKKTIDRYNYWNEKSKQTV